MRAKCRRYFKRERTLFAPRTTMRGRRRRMKETGERVRSVEEERERGWGGVGGWGGVHALRERMEVGSVGGCVSGERRREGLCVTEKQKTKQKMC